MHKTTDLFVFKFTFVFIVRRLLDTICSSFGDSSDPVKLAFSECLKEILGDCDASLSAIRSAYREAYAVDRVDAIDVVDKDVDTVVLGNHYLLRRQGEEEEEDEEEEGGVRGGVKGKWELAGAEPVDSRLTEAVNVEDLTPTLPEIWKVSHPQRALLWHLLCLVGDPLLLSALRQFRDTQYRYYVYGHHDRQNNKRYNNNNNNNNKGYSNSNSYGREEQEHEQEHEHIWKKRTDRNSGVDADKADKDKYRDKDSQVDSQVDSRVVNYYLTAPAWERSSYAPSVQGWNLFAMLYVLI